MAVWFQRWSTAVLRGEGGWVAGRRWELLGGFFFQLGLRGLKQNAVDDWSAGRGGPGSSVCHLGLGDGRILEIYGFGTPISHLGLRNDYLLDMLSC